MPGTLGGYQLVTPVSDQQARPTINYKNGTITQMGPQEFKVNWTDKNGAAQSVTVFTLAGAQAWLDSQAAQGNLILPAAGSLVNVYQSILYKKLGQGITAEVGFDGLYYWTDWIDGSGQEQHVRMNDLASAMKAVDTLTTQVSPAQSVTNYITSIPQQVSTGVQTNVQQTVTNVATQTTNAITGAISSTFDKYGLYLIIIIVVFLLVLLFGDTVKKQLGGTPS